MKFILSLNCAPLKEDPMSVFLLSLNCASLKEDPVGRGFVVSVTLNECYGGGGGRGE